MAPIFIETHRATGVHTKATTAATNPITRYGPISRHTRIARSSLALFSFDVRNLCYPPLVAPTLESPRQELIDNREGDRLPQYAAAKSKDVCIVVLSRQPRHEFVLTQRSANTMNLVSGNCLALAAATKDHSEVRIPANDCAPHGRAKRRIVDRVFRVGTQVDYVVAGIGQMF